MAEEKTRPHGGAESGKTARAGDAPAENTPEGQDAPERQGTREEKEMATTNNDPLLRERREMYEGFIKSTVFGTVAVAIILILLAIFLV